MSINIRNSNNNRRRAIKGGGTYGSQQQQDQAALRNAGNPYLQGGGYRANQTPLGGTQGGASTVNMAAQMGGSAAQGMQQTTNPDGLKSRFGPGQTTGWTTGGYNGGMNTGNGITPHGPGTPGGYQQTPPPSPSGGPQPDQQYGSDPQNPGAGGATDSMMEDAIRKALEAYMAGADEQGIMDRYQRKTDQSLIDSRARMGALGMSGSGASASLQSGIQQRGTDMAQQQIDRENQRLTGNAMNAVGIGIGLDNMAVRRALLAELYPENQIASPMKTGGGGTGGDGGDSASAVHAPDWGSSPLGAGSDLIRRNFGWTGLVPEGNFLNDGLIKHPANYGAAVGEAIFGGGGTPGTGGGGSFNVANNAADIPPNAVMLELDEAAAALGVPSLPFGTKVYKTPDGQIWVYTEM